MDHIEITTTTRQPLPTMDQYMKRASGWPNGPYLLQVVAVGEARLSEAGNKVRRIDFQIVGTDKMLYWFMADAEGAKWAWQDVVSHFVNLDLLAGRTFLVMCRNERYRETWTLRPTAFMAEVVD